MQSFTSCFARATSGLTAAGNVSPDPLLSNLVSSSASLMRLRTSSDNVARRPARLPDNPPMHRTGPAVYSLQVERCTVPARPVIGLTLGASLSYDVDFYYLPGASDPAAEARRLFSDRS